MFSEGWYALFGFLLIALFSGLSTAAAKAELRLNGVDYISLTTVAGRFGMERNWLTAKKQIALQSKWTRLKFEVHKRDIHINEVKVYFGSPVAYHRSDLYISRLDFEFTLSPILTPQHFTNVPKLSHIVIDPGHGGKDTGALGKKRDLTEKDLALNISRRLQKILESCGYKVILTRDSDKFLDLKERPTIANSRKADLFVSIHLNAAQSTSVRGVETYVFTPHNQPSTKNDKLHPSARKSYPGNGNDPWNALVGYYVQRELSKHLNNPDRGLKRARFAVLKTLHCPGLLVEAGFLSNTTEAQNLKSSHYRQHIAQTIANGIFRYQRTLNRLRGLSFEKSAAPERTGDVPPFVDAYFSKERGYAERSTGRWFGSEAGVKEWHYCHGEV